MALRAWFGRRVEKRTCTDCGYEWSVPWALRRPRRPSKWRSGLHLADVGPFGEVSPGRLQWALDQAARRRSEDEAEMALRSRLATCDQCGSRSYRSRRVRLRRGGEAGGGDGQDTA